MKGKLLRFFTCLIICSSMLIGLFSEPILNVFAVSQETQEAIDAAEQEKEELEQELQQQEQNKGNLESNKATEEKKLDNLKAQYKSISSDLEALEEKKTEKEEEIKVKTEELEEAIAIQEKQYADMKKRIQYMYEKPQDTLFDLLLQEGNIIQILNRVDNTLKIQEYDRGQLEQFIKNAEEIDFQKQELEAAKTELEGLIEEAEVQRQKVSSLQKQTTATINDYLKKIETAAAEIGDTQESLKEIGEILDELLAKAAAEKAAADRLLAEQEWAKIQEAIANGTFNVGDSGIVERYIELSEAELEMLTAIIYCESRGESYEGQLAVGYVVMNRVRSTKFAQNTVESVIRAPKQFSPVSSGYFDTILDAHRAYVQGVPVSNFDVRAWESCYSAAKECVNGTSNVGESLFFRTHAPVPQLAENLSAAGVPFRIIGAHIFYYRWTSY